MRSRTNVKKNTRIEPNVEGFPSSLSRKRTSFLGTGDHVGARRISLKLHKSKGVSIPYCDLALLGAKQDTLPVLVNSMELEN